MNFIERFINALLDFKPKKITLVDDLERIKRGLDKPHPPANRWY